MATKTKLKLSAAQERNLKAIFESNQRGEKQIPPTVKERGYVVLRELGMINFRWVDRADFLSGQYIVLSDVGREYAAARGWLAAPETPAPAASAPDESSAQDAVNDANEDSCEILIYGIEDKDDMPAIQGALMFADVANSDTFHMLSNIYRRHGKPSSVFVHPNDAAVAVKAINELGYKTDKNGIAQQHAASTQSQADSERAGELRHWTHEWNKRHIAAAQNADAMERTVQQEIIVSLVDDVKAKDARIAALEAERDGLRAALVEIGSKTDAELRIWLTACATRDIAVRAINRITAKDTPATN